MERTIIRAFDNLGDTSHLIESGVICSLLEVSAQFMCPTAAAHNSHCGTPLILACYDASPRVFTPGFSGRLGISL
jgi:hypothetical protein